MSPKPDPRDRIPIFRERHPRVANMLYQMGLCVGTFLLLITIGRYGPESEVPDRVERICPNGPIEDEFELGFLGVVMPHFMACPSTTTYIAAVILFLTGIVKLNYHNRNDVWLPYFMLFTFSMTLAGIKWKRFDASLQTFAPIYIWTASTWSALVHPIARWALPGCYRRAVEGREARKKEREMAEEEARRKKRQGDLERGEPQIGEPGELANSRVRIDEDTPLTGNGFIRMNNRVYVEIPGYSEEEALESSQH